MALRDSEMRRSATDAGIVDAVASALDIAIIIFDRHDTVVAASPEFNRFFVVPPEHLEPGARLRDLLGALYDAGARVFGSVNGRARNVTREDWIAERIAIHWRERYESVEQMSDGRWVRLSKRRMPDGILISTITDVSEQKRRDLELAEARHQSDLAQHILDNLATPVMVKDCSLRYVVVNDAFCRIPGLHAKHVLGRTAGELVGPEMAAKFEEIERGVLESGVPYETTEDIFRADGTVMHAITRARRSGTPGSYYVTVTFDDVSAFASSPRYTARVTSHYDAEPAIVQGHLPVQSAKRERILVLDEDTDRAVQRVAALKTAGADAVAIGKASEVVAFLDAAQASGLVLDSVEITTGMSRMMEGASGLDRHPSLDQAIYRRRVQETCAQLANGPVLEASDPEPRQPLPAVARSASARAPETPGAQSTKPEMAVLASGTPANTAENRIRVLVAEDNEVNQIVFEQILEGIGADFRIVCNGQEAVTAWRAGSPDLILMDVSMPVMNGLQATQAIRSAEKESSSERSHVPIIAVTAHAMSGDRERCFAAGMDDYLSKPVSPEKLESIISKWASSSSADSAAVLLAS
ncbi:response regulator [Hoeflea sp. G2-23]|uniref:Response regulator n=1 Tax=Hoeflea algicola TaxID=2983763 RepID=A0ABT3ZF83_9HYPH|nr:response regulator [Hoeflea algicola]MCY0150288.1 response regulator [Hoeflea algicola]